MASLISTSLKNSLLSAIDDVHDTFSKTIIIINEIANVTVVESDNYNAFSDEKNSNITYTATSQEITARIKYIDKPDAQQQLIFAGGGGDKSGGSSVYVKQNYGIVRIKVKVQYKDLVKNSTKVIINGEDCQILLNYNSQDIVDENYSVFYLTRQQ